MNGPKTKIYHQYNYKKVFKVYNKKKLKVKKNVAQNFQNNK